MYKVRIETGFCAAHRIDGYQGKCAQIHGHNWKIEVIVSSQKLNKLGMVIDFREIKCMVKEIAEEFDHKYLNEIPCFSMKTTTAEVLAEYIYFQLVKLLFGIEEVTPLAIEEVRVWETDTSYGAYCNPAWDN